jgi:tetratricopeptide (TPR) repeat protein
MKSSKILTAIFIFLVAITAALLARAQTPQDTLNQYISQLQSNPNDTALREKIIKFVQTMNPAPAVPEAVDELIGQAKYVFKRAKEQKDYLDAVDAYKKVVNLAPWVGDYYFNLGVAQEQAGQPADAIKSFNLYLVAAPYAKDAREVRQRIGGLKYAANKAARESAVVAKKQNEYEEWLSKINGRKYRETRGGPAIIEVRGKSIVLTAPGVMEGPWEIKEHSASTPRVMRQLPFPVQTTFTITEDGDRIIEHRDFIDGEALEFVWIWQR